MYTLVRAQLNQVHSHALCLGPGLKCNVAYLSIYKVILSDWNVEARSCAVDIPALSRGYLNGLVLITLSIITNVDSRIFHSDFHAYPVVPFVFPVVLETYFE